MVKPIRQWLNHCALGVLFAFGVGCAAPRKTELAAGGTPLERTLAENPDDPKVNLALGQASEAAGDLLRAEQYYRRAEALGIPAEQMVPRLVRVLAAAQRYDEALERCRRRLNTKPDDRATRYVEAALLVALERPKEAERDLDALKRTRPDDPQAWLALGKLYRDGYNDRARARVMFERYLMLAPNGEAAPAVRFELADDAPPPAPASPAPAASLATPASPAPKEESTP